MTHKLLLADDSVTIQRVVELTFSGEDVTVVTVGDGEQAIARIPVEMPDVVLADIGMPKRSGYDVAAFVKGRPDLAHIPVVLLAGAFEPVDEARAEQVQSDGVLVKPFEPQQVIARVKDLIERARASAAAKAAPPAPTVAVPAPPSVAPASVVEPPQAQQVVQPPPPESPLGDYFDRLDAAFAQLGAELRPSPPQVSAAEEPETAEVPTLERILGSEPGPGAQHVEGAGGEARQGEPRGLDESPMPAPMEAPAMTGPEEPAAGRNLVADMFAALFAAEQGEAAPTPLPPARVPQPPVVTDQLIDEVTRRVIERLAPDAASELVAQIVSEVAERLVREEIVRIRSAVVTKL